MNLGGYRIVEELARGGMGVVFRARAPGEGRDVALKLLHAGKVNEARRERFRREAEVTARLEHPGIVRVHGAGFEGEQAYVVFELVEGAQTLSDLLPRVGQGRRLELIEEVARALGHAHQQGVVHRDVKPDNVLITPEGAAKVADFGLAQAPGLERMTQTGQMLGTPHYMAPEQFEADRDAMGPATDVWALGVMLFEALTDQLPFQGANVMALCARVGRGLQRLPSATAPGVSRALDAVCAQALQPDVGGRYPDAVAFAEDLRRARMGAQPKAPAVRSRGLPVALGLGAALGLLVLAGAAIWLVRSPAEPPVETPPRPPVEEQAPPPTPPAPADPPLEPLPRGLLTALGFKPALHNAHVLFTGDRELLVFEPGLAEGKGVQLFRFDDRAESFEKRPGWSDLRPAFDAVPDPRGGVLCTASGAVYRLLHGDPHASLVTRGGVRLVAVSPSGDLLAVVNRKGVRLIQRGERKPLHRWAATETPIQAVTFLDDDRLVWATGGPVLSGKENTVFLWDRRQPERGLLQITAYSYIRDLVWVPEREVLVLASDRFLPMISVGETLEQVGNLTKVEQDTLNPTFALGAVRALWLSTDQRRLAVLAAGTRAAKQSEVVCWDPITGDQVGEPLTLGNYATEFAVSPDEALLAVSTEEGVKIYSAASVLGR